MNEGERLGDILERVMAQLPKPQPNSFFKKGLMWVYCRGWLPGFLVRILFKLFRLRAA